MINRVCDKCKEETLFFIRTINGLAPKVMTEVVKCSNCDKEEFYND